MKSDELIGIQTVRPDDHEITVDDDDDINCQLCVPDNSVHELGQEEEFGNN